MNFVNYKQFEYCSIHMKKNWKRNSIEWENTTAMIMNHCLNIIDKNIPIIFKTVYHQLIMCILQTATTGEFIKMTAMGTVVFVY